MRADRGEEGVIPGASAAFDRHRPLLFSIAYRMLGSVMEAEDAVQEAYLRWRRASGEEMRSERAYLSTVVTRLCIDRLRSAQARREEYVGPWLPEPLPDERTPDVAETVAPEDSLSMAFLVLLESLTPVERAVFLLREVFGYEYAEIAEIVGKGEVNCRRISRRARASVAARRPRFECSPEQGERLTREFLEACAAGDMDRLLAVLAEDVTLWSDGGGRARAARNPIYGAANVARFFSGILRKAPPNLAIRPTRINGTPGLVGYFGDGRPHSVAIFEVAGGTSWRSGSWSTRRNWRAYARYLLRPDDEGARGAETVCSPKDGPPDHPPSRWRAGRHAGAHRRRRGSRVRACLGHDLEAQTHTQRPRRRDPPFHRRR